ncbi:MAG: DUF368 domain-containing protein [Candidatus Nanohaloarchaea archaeon]
MGAADSVPGVSGGTIALITGIYDRMISALTSVASKKSFSLLKSFLGLDFSEAWSDLENMDVPFLVLLGSGIVVSVLSMLRFMHFALSEFVVATYGVFFGLIAVSAGLLLKETGVSDRWEALAVFSGFLASFAASGVAAGSLNHSLPVLFVAGALAVSAMVLPGISGSLVLVILGLYRYLSGLISGFTDAVLVLDTGSVLELGVPVAVFVSGGVAGLFLTSALVEKALELRRNITIVFLVGLVFGALRAPVIQVGEAVSQGFLSVSPAFIVSAFAAGFLIWVLDRKFGVVEV